MTEATLGQSMLCRCNINCTLKQCAGLASKFGVSVSYPQDAEK